MEIQGEKKDDIKFLTVKVLVCVFFLISNKLWYLSYLYHWVYLRVM